MYVWDQNWSLEIFVLDKTFFHVHWISKKSLNWVKIWRFFSFQYAKKKPFSFIFAMSTCLVISWNVQFDCHLKKRRFFVVSNRICLIPFQLLIFADLSSILLSILGLTISHHNQLLIPSFVARVCYANKCGCVDTFTQLNLIRTINILSLYVYIQHKYCIPFTNPTSGFIVRHDNNHLNLENFCIRFFCCIALWQFISKECLREWNTNRMIIIHSQLRRASKHDKECVVLCIDKHENNAEDILSI